jgi:hypothetical protein
VAEDEGAGGGGVNFFHLSPDICPFTPTNPRNGRVPPPLGVEFFNAPLFTLSQPAFSLLKLSLFCMNIASIPA